MQPTRKIETPQDLIAWAKAVNGQPPISFTQEYGNLNREKLSDLFGHSEANKVEKAFVDLEGDRNLVLFAMYQTSSPDQVFSYLQIWARNRARKYIEEQSAAIDQDFHERDKIMRAQEKAIQDREKAIQETIQQLTRRAENAEHEIEKNKAEIADKAHHLRTYDQAITDQEHTIIEQGKEIERLQTTIKMILKIGRTENLTAPEN